MTTAAGINASLSFDLGGERALVQHIRCQERLGQPFVLTVEVAFKLGEIDVLEHLGQPVSLSIQEWNSYRRFFHGILTDSEFVEENRYGYRYRLTLRPFTYFLDNNRGFAIFQAKSAVDIIRAVLSSNHVNDVEYNLSESYEAREYCVQYGESDFSFVSRLMQEEGIYYYYRHEERRHVLVLCDGAGSHRPGSPASLVYNPIRTSSLIQVAGSKRQHGTFHQLRERTTSSGEGKITLRDFDFERPTHVTEGVTVDKSQHASDGVEVYDYPGGFVKDQHGAALSKVLLRGLRAQRQLYIGETDSLTLTCGATLRLNRHPAGRFNKDYLIVGLTQSFTIQAPEDDPTFDREQEANTIFEAIPAATTFHTPRTIPRPQVRGLETAVVAGPAGETIYTDKYGRVKVHFPWDRSNTGDENSTCWIRVAQFGNLGSVVLPRVGQEVMVDFIVGDPDRPIVCGWVFNADHMPVYDLPANKTRALWRTKRYGDPGQYPDTKAFDIEAPGVNELRFEDKGGSEEVFIHAERDMNTRVRFDQSNQVAHDQNEKVGHNRTAYVGVDETTTIDKNQTLTVGAKQDETIKGDREIKVDNTDTLTIGQSQTIKAGTTIEISANTSITLKVGTSSIVIDTSGVTIKGMNLVNDAQVESATRALSTKIAGSAMTEIQGAIVKIN